MESWKTIPSFHGYSVSDHGRVRNDDSGRLMAIRRNQHGVCHVGLYKHVKQYKRGLALLVANAFVSKLDTELKTFTTPIHLDGDQSNNRADNLMWRPAWFALKYARQFNSHQLGIDEPIVDVNSKEQFANSWEAVTTYGLLNTEIMTAILNRTYVWPTYQEFRVLAD